MEKKPSEKIIADSGFLFALINKKDSKHIKAKEAADKYSKKWITTCFVFHEVFYLLNEPHHHLIPNIFSMEKTGLREVVGFERNQLFEIEKIVKKYSDQKLDFADASLILLAETLGHGDILTVDIKDFSTCRWKNKNSFNLLLEQL
jgi:hypothetical protein